MQEEELSKYSNKQEPLLNLKSNRSNISNNSDTSKHSTYSIKIAACTWNLKCSLPTTNSVKIMMNYIVDSMFEHDTPDIILIATQECEKSYMASFCCCEGKDGWQNLLRNSSLNYQIVQTQTLVGLHNAVLVKKDLVKKYSTLQKIVYKAGTCNILGNKGAISLTFTLFGQCIQFINCHLAPHQTKVDRRNQVLMQIADQIVDQDYRKQVFICGDLNYRINITKQQYQQKIKDKYNTQKQMKYMEMLPLDQLVNQQILCSKFLPFYKQQPITFPPTYKLAINKPQYNRQRIPGWTDRIFIRKGRLREVKCVCLYELEGSDHRPVVCSYLLDIDQALSISRAQIQSACQLI